LRNIIANPEQQISSIPLLSDDERQRSCFEWNQTRAEYPRGRCLHDLFAEQVELTPDSVAVVAGGCQFTYRELDRVSNQLAHYLRGIGVVPETVVGLYFEPSAEMVIATLAVLKAGGACVPLDPKFPSQRLADIAEDTKLWLLLTQAQLQHHVAAKNLRILRLDEDQTAYNEESSYPVPNRSAPDNLAYVIYTSGSTGTPKGVEITHQNLVHSTYARSLYYGADAGRFLLLSSFAVDSSLAGIFGTLTRGGTLVLTPGPIQSNLTELSRQIAEHRISHLLCVPSLYSLLLEQALSSELASLRVAIVAGESCPVELVDRHFALLPETALYNEYGPTETAVWATVHKCATQPPRRPVSIGRPIPNVRIYVLDRYMNPVPVGVPGELYIGGPGVTRGYFNRHRETAERFIQDPFVPIPGNRLYKTGDRVRYLPNGNLELLGRLDNQVKLRGFRIELEEIEAFCSQYPQVRNAVVVVHHNEKGECSLIAFVVVVDPSGFDSGQLRGFLAERLPEAMIPSSFVVVEKLPVTASGKLDRHALMSDFEDTPPPRPIAPQNNIQ